MLSPIGISNIPLERRFNTLFICTKQAAMGTLCDDLYPVEFSKQEKRCARPYCKTQCCGAGRFFRLRILGSGSKGEENWLRLLGSGSNKGKKWIRLLLRLRLQLRLKLQLYEWGKFSALDPAPPPKRSKMRILWLRLRILLHSAGKTVYWREKRTAPAALNRNSGLTAHLIWILWTNFFGAFLNHGPTDPLAPSRPPSLPSSWSRPASWRGSWYRGIAVTFGPV